VKGLHCPLSDANQNYLADFTVADRDNAKACDLMLAYFEKDNPSGLGLAAEIGIAAAVGKGRIYLVDEHKHIHGLLAGLCYRIFTDLDAALEYILGELE